MLKRLIIILFSSFLGIVGNPEFLTASDSVVLTGLNEANIVETIPLPEPEPEPELMITQVESAPVYYTYVELSYVVPVNSIQIAGRNLEIVDVADTRVDAGSHVNKYGDKFLYGHNSWAVFGSLANMGAGSTFTVTYEGVTTAYQVQQVAIFEHTNGLLQIDGVGNYMFSVSKARYQGVNYGLSLMTCYGESYGNGDASHRLVLFANAI